MKLNICIVLEVIFAALIIYVPALQGIFSTINLTPQQMLTPWATFVFISICEEVRKSFVRKKSAKSAQAKEVCQLKVGLLAEV